MAVAYMCAPCNTQHGPALRGLSLGLCRKVLLGARGAEGEAVRCYELRVVVHLKGDTGPPQQARRQGT